MNKKLTDFKETLHQGMIENFQRDGYLTPIIFFVKDGVPVIGQIPYDLLKSPESKHFLAEILKKICQEPTVIAAGLIMEANGAKLDNDNEMANLIMNGDIKVSELKEKQDIIVMIFSTPEDEEMIAYEVNVDNRTVGELFGGEKMNKFGGLFSNFFTWNVN